LAIPGNIDFQIGAFGVLAAGITEPRQAPSDPDAEDAEGAEDDQGVHLIHGRGHRPAFAAPGHLQHIGLWRVTVVTGNSQIRSLSKFAL
jgi:hypothetical protein